MSPDPATTFVTRAILGGKEFEVTFSENPAEPDHAIIRDVESREIIGLSEEQLIDLSLYHTFLHAIKSAFSNGEDITLTTGLARFGSEVARIKNLAERFSDHHEEERKRIEGNNLVDEVLLKVGEAVFDIGTVLVIGALLGNPVTGATALATLAASSLAAGDEMVEITNLGRQKAASVLIHAAASDLANELQSESGELSDAISILLGLRGVESESRALSHEVVHSLEKALLRDFVLFEQFEVLKAELDNVDRQDVFDRFEEVIGSRDEVGSALVNAYLSQADKLNGAAKIGLGLASNAVPLLELASSIIKFADTPSGQGAIESIQAAHKEVAQFAGKASLFGVEQAAAFKALASELALYGSNADDIILARTGTSVNDDLNPEVFGLSGDDDVSGGDGSDVIFGGQGSDTIRPGLGADAIRLGFGGVDEVVGTPAELDGDTIVDLHHEDSIVVLGENLELDDLEIETSEIKIIGEFGDLGGSVTIKVELPVGAKLAVEPFRDELGENGSRISVQSRPQLFFSAASDGIYEVFGPGIYSEIIPIESGFGNNLTINSSGYLVTAVGGGVWEGHLVGWDEDALVFTSGNAIPSVDILIVDHLNVTRTTIEKYVGIDYFVYPSIYGIEYDRGAYYAIGVGSYGLGSGIFQGNYISLTSQSPNFPLAKPELNVSGTAVGVSFTNPSSVRDLALDPSGTLYGLVGIERGWGQHISTIDKRTEPIGPPYDDPLATKLVALSSDVEIFAIASTSDGKLVGYGEAKDYSVRGVYEINLSTGEHSYLGDFLTGTTFAQGYGDFVFSGTIDELRTFLNEKTDNELDAANGDVATPLDEDSSQVGEEIVGDDGQPIMIEIPIEVSEEPSVELPIEPAVETPMEPPVEPPVAANQPSQEADMMSGSSSAETMSGLGGDDTMRAGGGDDTVLGGNGDDRMFGQGGNDRVVGQAGNDIAKGNGGDDFLKGSGGDDTLIGGGGDDSLRGNGADDSLKGGGGADNLKGGGGDDTILGNGGADDIKGGGGNDVINAGRGDDTIKGNGGADTFQFRGNDGSDTINGFQQGQDLIEIVSGANSFGALDISQDGRNVLIEFANTDITITNARTGQFAEDDFLFS